MPKFAKHCFCSKCSQKSFGTNICIICIFGVKMSIWGSNMPQFAQKLFFPLPKFAKFDYLEGQKLPILEFKIAHLGGQKCPFGRPKMPTFFVCSKCPPKSCWGPMIPKCAKIGSFIFFLQSVTTGWSKYQRTGLKQAQMKQKCFFTQQSPIYSNICGQQGPRSVFLTLHSFRKSIIAAMV